MSIIFISDTHLQESDSATTKLFIKFLDELAPLTEGLYILGDLFEAWIGDDDDALYNLMIIEAIKRLTQKNVPVYIMPGNRDFLLGKKFAEETGCQLLPDPTLVTVYNIPVLLSHGDKLCTHDSLQKWFRRLSGSRLSQTLFVTCLPLWLRRKLALFMRSLSKKHNKHKSMKDMDITENAVIRSMELHNVLYLIHGHVHRAEVHPVPLETGMGTRIVIGAWQQDGEILVCKPSIRNSLEFKLISVKGIL